jgi:hypothetical protein
MPHSVLPLRNRGAVKLWAHVNMDVTLSESSEASAVHTADPHRRLSDQQVSAPRFGSVFESTGALAPAQA